MDINIKNLKKQYENFIYPKPTEDIDKDYIQKKKALLSDPYYFWHRLWPEKPLIKKGLKILVAGCGSQQASILAHFNKKHFFTAVDLSKTSIDHNYKLKKKHNIQNLNLICEDFRNLKFEEKFDYIISTGVIHHLEEPDTAINYFEKNLTDLGVIYLMVYGSKESRPISEMKKVFNMFGFDQNKKSILQGKNIINQLLPDHPVKIFSNKFYDKNYDEGFVDLFLHKHEKFFSIKELFSLIERNNLMTKNCISENISSGYRYFYDDAEMSKKFKQMKLEDQLEISQILNWSDRKIIITCCKKNLGNRSIIKMDLNFDELYIFGIRGAKYNFSKTAEGIIIEINYKKEKFKFLFNKFVGQDLVKLFQGNIKVSELTKLLNIEESVKFKQTLETIYRCKLLDISFHPVNNL